MNKGRSVGLLLLAALLLPAGGCVERKLLIRSEPAGAEIFMNGERLPEKTPYEVSFMHYGTYDVVLSAPGHHRLRTEVPVRAPWYETFPVDFVSELLWPFTLTDRHVVSLELTPLEDLRALTRDDHEAILIRAEKTRERLERHAEEEAQRHQ